VCSIAVFLASLDSTVLFVAFQDIRRSYPQVSSADLSWVINAYTIAYAALLVPAGRLADRYGKKLFFLGGVALFCVASLFCGLAPNATLLVLARVLQAAGAAALLPSSLALVLDAFPPERRASAVGIWGAVGALAAAIGPSLGSVMVEELGWEWVFFINLPLGAYAIVRGRALLHESEIRREQGVPDVLGIVLLVLAMAAAAAAIVKGEDWGYTSQRTLVVTGGALVALALFALRSRRVPNPAVDLRLFSDTRFSFANAALFVYGTAFTVMFFGNVFYLTQQWHYSLSLAGMAITPGPLTVIPFAMISGRIADKHGHRGVLLLGSLLFAIGGAWFVLTVNDPPNFLGVWLPRSILTGISVGLVLPSLSGAAVASLPRADFALGSAISQATRQFGSVIGVAIAVSLLGDSGLGNGAVGFERAYSVVVVGALLTGALCLPLSRPRTTTGAASVPQPLPIPEI
jgi:EmrB/QacA subfamily drug resistance transporter